MSEKKKKPEDYIEAYKKAVRRVWEDVKQKSMLVQRRETQIHVLLGHYLLLELESKKLKLWKDFDIYFDTPEGRFGEGGLDWALFAKIRPDVVIRPNDRGLLGIVVELKCLRLVDDRLEGNPDEPEFQRYYVREQTARWEEDREKMGLLVDQARGNAFLGYQLTYAKWDKRWKGLKKTQPWGDWEDTHDISDFESVGFKNNPIDGDTRFLGEPYGAELMKEIEESENA